MTMFTASCQICDSCPSDFFFFPLINIRLSGLVLQNDFIYLLQDGLKTSNLQLFSCSPVSVQMAVNAFTPVPLVFQEDINAIEMEEDKRDLISREISKFRDTHKVVFLFLHLIQIRLFQNPKKRYYKIQQYIAISLKMMFILGLIYMQFFTSQKKTVATLKWPVTSLC